MAKNFNMIFDAFSQNISKSEQILEKSFAEGSLLKNDILRMTTSILELQQEFAVTYGDRTAIELSDKKVARLESQYGELLPSISEKSYVVNKEEFYDDMNAMYERNLSLMAHIYEDTKKMNPTDSRREENSYYKLLVGEVTNNLLDTQALFVDSFFSEEEKNPILDRIKDKKEILIRSLKNQETHEFDTTLKAHRR